MLATVGDNSIVNGPRCFGGLMSYKHSVTHDIVIILVLLKGMLKTQCRAFASIVYTSRGVIPGVP